MFSGVPVLVPHLPVAPPPPPPYPIPPAALASAYTDAAGRAESVFNTYTMDLVRTLCCLIGVGPTVTFRAQALFQRLISVAKKEEFERNKRKCTSESSKDSPLMNCPDCVEVQQLRSVVSYDDVFHRLEGLRFSDDSMLYYGAAAVLVTCKLECPQAKIRLIVHAVHRLNYRRKQRIGPIAAAAAPPAIRPEVYDALKRQIVQAEWILLIQLGFQVTVECPHKFVFPFLALMIDRGASTESNDLFLNWSMEACTWLNDCPRLTNVNGVDATVLACAALVLRQPSDVLQGLPMDWPAAFGVQKDVLAACLEKFAGSTAKQPQGINAPNAVDAELARYQVAKTMMLEGKRHAFGHSAVSDGPAPPAVSPKLGSAGESAVDDTLPRVVAPPHSNHPQQSGEQSAPTVLLPLGLPPPPPVLPPAIDISEVVDISVKRKEKKEKRDKKEKQQTKRDSSPVQGERDEKTAERKRSRSLQRRGSSEQPPYDNERDLKAGRELRDGRRRERSYREDRDRRDDRYRDERDDRYRDERDDRYRDERDDRYRVERDDRYRSIRGDARRHDQRDARGGKRY